MCLQWCKDSVFNDDIPGERVMYEAMIVNLCSNKYIGESNENEREVQIETYLAEVFSRNSRIGMS